MSYEEQIPQAYRKEQPNREHNFTLGEFVDIVTPETLPYFLIRVINESKSETEYRNLNMADAARTLNWSLDELYLELKKYENPILKKFNVINAVEWLNSEPPPPDQIIEDLFDKGDKVGIIGGSKQKKSFFFIQMVMCLATGRDFLGLPIPKKRRVLMVQFEINKNHYHRRVKKMAKALGITPEELGENLLIINARGQKVTAAEVEKEICQIALESKVDFVAFDPLYKLMKEGEIGPAEFKPILCAFDYLAEKAESAVAYVHHDPKGEAGDRNLQDRGAGSNILGRDYDACFALSAHGCGDNNVAVVEVLLRNYSPKDGISIEWDGNCFISRPDLPPTKRTSKTKRNADKPDLDEYEPQALKLVKDKPLKISVFKDNLKKNCVLTNERMKAVIDLLKSTGKLAVHSDRGRAKNDCWIGLPAAIEEMKHK